MKQDIKYEIIAITIHHLKDWVLVTLQNSRGVSMEVTLPLKVLESRDEGKPVLIPNPEFLEEIAAFEEVVLEEVIKKL